MDPLGWRFSGFSDTPFGQTLQPRPWGLADLGDSARPEQKAGLKDQRENQL